MALTWNLEGIENHKERCFVPDPETSEEGEPLYTLNHVTETLIWQTIPTGMHEITEANHEEFFTRVATLETAFGIWLKTYTKDKEAEPRPITLQDVRDHIGLKTNASPYSKAQFNGYITRRLRDEAVRLMDSYRKE